MHPSVRTILRFIGASVVGYPVIALGQTLVLEVGLKGRVGPDSPVPILGLAAFLFTGGGHFRFGPGRLACIDWRAR